MPRCNCCGYKQYGFWSLIFDLCMIGVTWGVWLLWIFVREMRRPRPCMHHRFY